MQKLITNMEDYGKHKESPCIKYWDLNYLYEWTIPQKLPVNNFKWAGNISDFDESFIKIIMKKVMKDIFLKLMLNTQKTYITFTMINRFCLNE